jgi:hypothetical protein
MGGLEPGDQGELNGGGVATNWSPEMTLASPTAVARGSLNSKWS